MTPVYMSLGIAAGTGVAVYMTQEIVLASAHKSKILFPFLTAVGAAAVAYVVLGK